MLTNKMLRIPTEITMIILAFDSLSLQGQMFGRLQSQQS